VTRPIQFQVRGRLETVLRAKRRARADDVLVARLGDVDGVRPTHWKSGTTRVDKTTTWNPKCIRGDRRKSEIGVHPFRKKKAVIEIIEINFGSIEIRRGMKLSQ
jgi:hypothetical protein